MSAAKPLDILRRALQEQRVADAHHEVIELAADILAPAMHGQRVDAVAPSEAQIAKAAADHARAPA